MSEFHDAFEDGKEEDPRTQLADVFRGFFLRAVEEQSLRDYKFWEKTNNEGHPNSEDQPGVLYKTDGGWLKINLERPAGDRVFNVNEQKDAPPRQTIKEYPSIWALIPLPQTDESNEDIDLRDVILCADNLLVHLLLSDGEDIEIWIRDDLLSKNRFDESASIERLGSETDEQKRFATVWIGLLKQYDLRAISTSSQSAA